jgi:hypothetical protein
MTGATGGGGNKDDVAGVIVVNDDVGANGDGDRR